MAAEAAAEAATEAAEVAAEAAEVAAEAAEVAEEGRVARVEGCNTALPAGAGGALVFIEAEAEGNDEVEVKSDEVDSEDDDKARASEGGETGCCAPGLWLSPQPSMPAGDAATCFLDAEPRASW